MAFDAQAAKAAGYSDAEIADFLAAESKFDIAGARTAGYSDAEIIADLSTATPSRVAAKKSQPPPSTLDQLKRQVGLAGRALYQGVTDLPALGLDAATGVFNYGRKLIGGDPYYVTLDDGSKKLVDPSAPLPLASDMREQELNSFGVPEPASPEERVANLGMRGFTGSASIAKTAAALPGQIPALLAARPGLQAVSGATGGISSGIAREQGAGPIGQTVAGLLGGLAPAFVAPRVPQPAPLRPMNQAAARAQVGPGVAQADAAIQATPEIQVRTGGVDFGTVGPDPSAGLTASQQRIAQRGAGLGFRQTPGLATGSRALQQIEAKLESQPQTSGPFNEIKANNARVVNRAAAQAIGESADIVDDVVLSRAANRIGDVFEQVADDVARPIEPRGFVQFLAGLQEETRGLVSGLTRNPLVEDLTNFASQGTATGRQLSSLTSKLGKAAYKQMSGPSGDRDLGIALYRVKDYVDDLIAQGLTSEGAQAFDTARREYRNLMLLTQRVGVVNPSTGNVSGRALANVLQQKDKRGYLYGQNQTPMYEAARFSQAFGPIVGDSGTATRIPFQGITDFVTRIPLNLAARAYTSSPAVNLAVRAQTLGSAARRAARPPTARDLPPAGLIDFLLSQDQRNRN